MADTRPDVILPAGVWVNCYTATGIVVGTAIDIYNKGSQGCTLVIKATQPATPALGMYLFSGSTGSHAYITAGESGLWAYSDGGTRILIQEMV